jgi:hypothetical protein
MPELNKKPRSKWRWLKRGLFGLVVLITLLAFIVVFENWRGRRAWTNYRAELEAKGEVLDWRQIVPQDIPDEQNFAMTPLLAPLSDYELDSSTGEPAFADLDAKEKLDSMFGWIQQLPGRGNWRKVETNNWSEIRDELRSRTNSEIPEIQALLKREPGPAHEDVLFLLSFAKNEMDEIRAAAERPYSSFNTAYEDGFSVILPQLKSVRVLSRGFTLKPQAELAAGNSDVALADWRSSVDLRRLLDGDIMLLSLLVQIAMVDTTFQVVWEGLVSHSWSDAQLVEIQNTLEGLNMVAEGLRAYRGERAFSLVTLDYQFRADGPGSMKPRGLRSFLVQSILSQNKIGFCRLHQDYIFPLLDPEARLAKVGGVKANELKVEEEFGGFNPYRMLAKMLFPAISSSIYRIANAQTAIHLATVACALERYRLSENRHPDNLDVLVPRFLKSIPLDLDEQPLRYSVQPDGSFVLYSIGVDLKDDNGRIGKEDGTFTTEEGDWVWKYPDAEAL